MLLALVGDMESHGHGALQIPPQDIWTVVGKLVTTVDTIADTDDLAHPTGPTNSATGSAKWTVKGKAIHRHDDLRYCGAATVVTSQSIFSIGDS